MQLWFAYGSRGFQPTMICPDMFYNPKRKHATKGMLVPVGFESQQNVKPLGVWGQGLQISAVKN